ncbi:hypothetical protein [Actinoplanes sp. NPDC049118]|uniref:hypothetical protein n=1 Tax=Actinoplanes sp. NPDC049118 TaxID=3155769 RepID=UPI0033CC9EC3
MSLTASITGRAELRRLAAQIKAVGDKGMAREMSAALRKAGKPVAESVRREAIAAMPARGGYRAEITRSLKFRVAQRTGARTASLTLTTYADGTKERRDIRALDDGRLRHPVYGRSRRIKRGPRAGTAQPNPWSMTRIRAGFHRRGTDGAADEAAREIGKVLDDFASRLLKG